ncbi:hypothetical protein TNCV_905101 [Trichonephila clavipes]|nr:hypothetical protein TNCV_905101 [Trichonephila clavipes]
MRLSSLIIRGLQERQCLQTTACIQDGANPHIGRQVKALLSDNFDRVCRGGIRTLPDLKASLIRHVAEMVASRYH